MSVLKDLEPKDFFRFFEEISEIPRGSGNRRGIAEYLVTFAKERGLEYIKDDFCNVIIKKPAQGGSASQEAVIIQGHTDMVTVSAPGKDKDFINEGIELLTDGEYVYADGTTLGADDGVAVCFALMVLDNKELIHPPIEAVFTADEEIGLIGAGKLDTSLLSGKTFLNIDSEDDGIFFAGCAGGATCEFSKKTEALKGRGFLAEISLENLTGGHSGMEIDKRRGNANKLMGSLIYDLLSEYKDCELVSFTGGEKENAIAVSAKAKVLFKCEDDYRSAAHIFDKHSAALTEGYKTTDPEAGYSFRLSENEIECEHIAHNEAMDITGFISGIPDGVLKMSEEVDDVVETSSNIGITDISPKGSSVTVSVRSLKNHERDAHTDVLKEKAGGIFGTDISGVYSAWSYSPQSCVRAILMEEYEKVTGKKARQEVIHAGLECGVFAEKMPGTDFVSFGPQADDIHTFKERLSISSVAHYREILINTLKRLA